MKKPVFVSLGMYLVTFLLVGMIPQMARAQEDTTIVTDSLYSTPEIDGFIQYSEYYSTLFVNTNTQEYIAGDGWNWITGGEDHERSYLSFDLSPLPDSIIVLEVTVSLYQAYSYGNDTLGRFPIWDVPGGDTLFCIMDHINYGAYLDTSDWGAGDPGNPRTLASNIGVVSDDTTIEYKTLDVTKYLQADIETGRARSQFRIRFPIDTDYDDRDDYLVFINSRTSSFLHRPYILVRYNKQNAVEEWGDYSHPGEFRLEQNYPNPFNATTAISYQLSAVRPHHTTLKIYNILGEEVRTLVDSRQKPGEYQVVWNGKDKGGRNVSSGIYFCRLEVEGLKAESRKLKAEMTRKMVLLR